MANPGGNPPGNPAERTGRRARARPESRGTTAILAATIAFPLSGVLGYLPVKEYIDYGLNDQPVRTLVVLGLYFGAAALLLLGSLLTFFRAVAGAVLLLIGGLVATAAVVAEPTLIHPGLFVAFFRAVFEFIPDDAFVRVAATVGGPVVFVLAALPATFRYLRHRPPELTYGPPRGHPRQDW